MILPHSSILSIPPSIFHDFTNHQQLKSYQHTPSLCAARFAFARIKPLLEHDKVYDIAYDKVYDKD